MKSSTALRAELRSPRSAISGEYMPILITARSVAQAMLAAHVADDLWSGSNQVGPARTVLVRPGPEGRVQGPTAAFLAQRFLLLSAFIVRNPGRHLPSL